MSPLDFNWENQQNALSALTDKLNHALDQAGSSRKSNRERERKRVTKAEAVCRIEMRELTLVESMYLASGLLLSLVLPLIMSFCVPKNAAAKPSSVKKVWLGQLLLALAGLTIIASGLLAPYAAVFGVVSCVFCAFMLFRVFRVAGPA